MICIIDYGVGNIQAFLNLCKRLEIPAKRVLNEDDFNNCSRIILPGVGHFDHAMNKLNNSGLLPILNDLVILKNIPVMGVCVGMQMLSDSSEEGSLPGLGWIPGQVKSMKYNQILIQTDYLIWVGIQSMQIETQYYFLKDLTRILNFIFTFILLRSK